MPDSIRTALRRVASSYVVFVVLGLVVGLALAPVAWNATNQPEGTVAVVPLSGTIDGQSSAQVSAALTQARQDSNIEAVVIVSNSGGGLASASEELYLQTKRTADQMPVVAAVDAVAASGAYYTVAAADTIYAKPSSAVGSVGVLTTLPPELEPNDFVGTTGPDKVTSGDEKEIYSLLESNRRAFVNSIYEQRGDRLELSRAELSEAQIYVGSQAVGNGLVDEIGGREAAVRRAASMANLSDYRVRVVRPDGSSYRFLSRANYLASSAPAESKRMVSMEYLVGERTGPPMFLMVPGSYLADASREAVTVGPTGPSVVGASESSDEPASTAGTSASTDSGSGTPATANATATNATTDALGPGVVDTEVSDAAD